MARRVHNWAPMTMRRLGMVGFLFVAACAGGVPMDPGAQQAELDSAPVAGELASRLYIESRRVPIAVECTATYACLRDVDGMGVATCLQEALIGGYGARGTIVHYTEVGDPVAETVVVEPLETGARVVVFHDRTKDLASDQRVWRETCTNMIVGTDACPPARGQACGDKVFYN